LSALSLVRESSIVTANTDSTITLRPAPK
jgi:hypothetical protein